ncbi:MAG: serine hydrolase [Zavarzinella sp.]
MLFNFRDYFAVLITFISATISQAVDWDQLKQEIRKFRTDFQVPGCAVVVVDRQQTKFQFFDGKRDSTSSVDSQTLFPLASCSKGFTSALLASFVEQGKCDWNDPVVKHYPKFTLSDPITTKLVTIRDLLSHRTGVGSYDLLWYYENCAHDELFKRMSRLPMHSSDFRSRMQYQSTMYTLAGEIAGACDQTTWAESLQTHLLQPLGMKNTYTLPPTRENYSKRAVGHYLRNDKLETATDYPFSQPDAAGSIHSTIEDAAKWLRFHLNFGKHQQQQIVASKELKETHSPQITIPVNDDVTVLAPETNLMSYAMGWVTQDYRGHQLVSHAGVIDGFRIHWTFLPKDGLGFAIFANLHETRMNLALAYHLVDRLLDLPPRAWGKHFLEYEQKIADEQAIKQLRMKKFRRQDVRPTLELAAYCGSYHHPSLGVFTIEVAQQHLIMRRNSLKIPLQHHGGDIFQVQESQVRTLSHELLLFVVEKNKCQSFRIAGWQFDKKK